jgi:hypothetical protein
MDNFIAVCVASFIVICLVGMCVKYHMDNEADKKDFKKLIDNIDNKDYLKNNINSRVLDGKIMLINRNMNYLCVNVHVKDKVLFTGFKIPVNYLLVPECQITVIAEIPRVDVEVKIPQLKVDGSIEWAGENIYYRSAKFNLAFMCGFQHRKIRVNYNR